MCKVNIDALEMIRLKQTKVRKSCHACGPVFQSSFICFNGLSTLSILVSIVLVWPEFSFAERDQLKQHHNAVTDTLVGTLHCT